MSLPLIFLVPSPLKLFKGSPIQPASLYHKTIFMKIEKNSVVSIDYTLTDSNGVIIDTSSGREPLTYLHGVGALIPGMETALQGKAAGEKFKITIAPEQAYGQRDESLLRVIAAEELKGVPDLKVGTQLQADTEAGVRVFTVIKIEGDKVGIDGNHPLAGITLNFDLDVKEVREATSEEIDHGHVHGPDGHHH